MGKFKKWKSILKIAAEISALFFIMMSLLDFFVDRRISGILFAVLMVVNGNGLWRDTIWLLNKIVGDCVFADDLGKLNLLQPVALIVTTVWLVMYVLPFSILQAVAATMAVFFALMSIVWMSFAVIAFCVRLFFQN